MNQLWRPEPSICPFCGKSFKWQSSMATHIKKVHQQQQQSQQHPNVLQQNSQQQQQQQNQRIPIWRQQEGDEGKQQNGGEEGREQQSAQQNEQPIVEDQRQQQFVPPKIVQKKEKPQKNPKRKGKVGRPAKNNIEYQHQIEKSTKAAMQKIAREMRIKRSNERKDGFGGQIGQQNATQQQNPQQPKRQKASIRPKLIANSYSDSPNKIHPNCRQNGPQQQMQQNEAEIGPQQQMQQNEAEIGPQQQMQQNEAEIGPQQQMQQNEAEIGPQQQMQQNEAGSLRIDPQIGPQFQQQAQGLEQEMVKNDGLEEQTNRRIKQEPAPMEEDDAIAAINAQYQQQPEQQFPLLHSSTASIVDEVGEPQDIQQPAAAAEEELVILEQVEQMEMKPDLVLAASNGLNSASQQFMLHAMEACSTGHTLNFSFDKRCRLIGMKAEFKCTKCGGQCGQIRCAKNYVFCRACCPHPACRPTDD